MKAGSVSRCPHRAHPAKRPCTTRPRRSQNRWRTCTGRPGGSTTCPGRCWPGSGWPRPTTTGTPPPALPARKGRCSSCPPPSPAYGVDGNDDGRTDIHDRADSVHSAANYLLASGVGDGPEGVEQALFAYNHADWYVNDVLQYTAAYGGGHVLADPTDCGPGAGVGNPDLPPITNERVQAMLSFAGDQVGEGYVLGANGPDAWDCSSLTQSAMAQIGVSAPRTAQAQRDWLALGNGFHSATVARPRPGDLIFYDSYLGPHTIGHVAIVWDPATMTTIEAANPRLGVGHFSYADDLDRNIFEIWRLGSVADKPTRHPVTPYPAARRLKGRQTTSRRNTVMQRERRHNPYPLTWEIPLGIACLVLLLLVLGAHGGRAAANLAAGGGLTFPPATELFPASIGLLRGDAAAGLDNPPAR